VESGAQKQQREYFLRKQMESIRKELGEDEGDLIGEYERKIAEAEMPEAVAEQVKSMELSGTPPQVADNFLRAYRSGGIAGYLNAELDAMRALESQSIYVSPFDKAILYARLNDRDQALRCLERAFGEHMRYVAYLNVAPFFDNLRDEPRFQELLKRVGLQAT